MYITKFCVVIMLFMNYLAFSQCQASFQYSTNGLSADFQSTSINAGSTLNSQTPKWDFGDGSPQVIGVDFINHVFTSSGLYNVCIEIFTWPTSWTTCSSIYCDTISIINPLCDSVNIVFDNSFNLQSYFSCSYNYNNLNGNISQLWLLYDTNNNLLHSDTAQNLLFNNSSSFDTISLCLETKIITSLDTNTCIICDDVFFDGSNWMFINLPNQLSSNFNINNNLNKIIFKRFNMLGQETKDNSSDPTIIIYLDGTVEKVIKLTK